MSAIPLDKKEIICESQGISIPALDRQWMSRSRFVAYVAPPSDSSDQGLMGEWLERLQYISTDLHWLLQLPHQKFWCQVIFDESLHTMLDSFLQYAPRPYDLNCELSGTSLTLHKEVSRLVFFTYLRMATYKESKENWLTPEVFGEIIYENFLFDVTKLMDLCALYGRSNAPLLSKMLGNIFAQQPKYHDDLRAAVPTIIQILKDIAVKCGLETEEEEEVGHSGLTPQRIDAGHQSLELETLELQELADVILYLHDTALTLTAFLTVYPQACGILHEMQFCSHLAHLYEKLIPAFHATFRSRTFDSVRQKAELRTKLGQAKRHLLSAFHSIVNHVCLQPVLTSASQEDEEEGERNQINQKIEEFLALMSSVLGERRFLADYEGQFSFQDDMDILIQAGHDVDKTHFSYIMEAVNAAFAAFGKRKKPTGNMNRGGRTSPDGSPCPPSAQSMVRGSGPPHQRKKSAETEAASEQGAEAKSVTGVELESLVCAVKDLLPHLGSGFIERALEELGYNVESVVSAVLENKLPQSLEGVDFSMENTAPQVDEFPAEPLLLESRRNIYDNDQFDVFNNPAVDVENIHKGKRAEDSGGSVLDDKEDLKAFKPLYDAYGSMDVPSMYDSRQYDDEYDDTYDLNNIGADDADSADELTHGRSFTVPRVLQRRPAKPRQMEESSEEEDERPRDQFVQDPALLRQQREQRFAAQNRRPPPRTYDVKGKAKGQGQTEEVVQNRKFKDKNKAARANHNRRAMSDRKQSKGMF